LLILLILIFFIILD